MKLGSSEAGKLGGNNQEGEKLVDIKQNNVPSSELHLHGYGSKFKIHFLNSKLWTLNPEPRTLFSN
jgi:hypothetical protein